MNEAPATIKRAYRVRLYPTPAQADGLRRVCGTRRWVWNWALGSRRDAYRRDGTKLTDLPADSTSYVDIAPASGSYDYSVAAYNASGESKANVNAKTTNCQ